MKFPPFSPRCLTRSRTLDISMPITPEMPVYPGDPAPELVSEQHQGVRLSTLSMSLHAGTHLDAPAHLDLAGNTPDGPWMPSPDETPMGRIPWQSACGPCCVVPAGPGPVDARQVLAWPLRAGDRVLVKATTPQGVHFTPEGALALADMSPILVGVEGFGPDLPENPDLPVHRIFLSRGILLLENLCLENAEPGRALLVCLGLLVPEAEAVPVRAVLTW